MDEDRRTCRVCITGGGGYIGSWLIRDLLLKGYYVNATFRDPGNENKTRHILSLPAARERLTLFKSDINEPGSFDSAVHGCDFVVHMATPMDYTKDPEMYYVAKTLAEQAALQYGSDHGIDVVTIAPSLVAGPFLTPTIPTSVALTLTPMTGNEQFYGYTRELQWLMGSVALVHIEDLCSAHIFLMEHPSAKGRYICSSESPSLHEMGDFCRKRYPQFSRSAKFLDDEVLKGVPISSKKLLDLGFSYKYGLPQIFDESIESAKKIGTLQ